MSVDWLPHYAQLGYSREEALAIARAAERAWLDVPPSSRHSVTRAQILATACAEHPSALEREIQERDAVFERFFKK